MRKFFALALAVAMVMSMASVSFAATSVLNDDAFAKALDYNADTNTVKYAKTYDPDWDNNTSNSLALGNMIEYGDTAYYPLVDESGSIKDFDRVEKLKVKAEFEMGEDLVESISIVKKAVDATSGTGANDKIGGAATDIVIDDTAFSIEWDATATPAKAVITYEGDFDLSALTYLDGAKTKAILAAAETAMNAAVATESNFTYAKADGSAVVAAGSALNQAETDSIAKVTMTASAVTALKTAINGATASSFGTTASADYYYFVAVKTKKVDTTADADIIGTFEFNRKADNKKGIAQIKDEEHDFAFNVWYDGNYNASNGTTPYYIDDEVDLKWDDMYVLKFNSDEEVTINFGYEPNEGEFTVDASGQGKLLINFNTKANEAICDANPGVEMFFVNFNDAKFNRTGTFEYEMEDMVAAYKVVDDQLVEIAGLELDGDTATFSTRTLGNYVFAAAELVNPTVAVEAPVVEAPAVTNPSTGA